jgi:ribosomal protein S18 acetylase RimI-like enzyme
MSYSFDVCHAFGDVWLSDDQQACALVLLPDKKRTTFQALIWDAKLAFSVIGVDRVSKVLARESKIKSFHPREPFSYLWFIGVAAENQNKGKGSRLLRELIEHSEQAQRPIYLETSVERNIDWYRQNGFEIFKSLELSYTLYLLRRPVKTTATNEKELIHQV